MTKPLLTVLMTVYNAEGFLKESMDSILRQSFTDFEFIIINDGSSDGSKEIIDQYATIDRRIRAIHQKNHGLVYSLNKGIGLAKGKIIARTDADDISMDNRLRDQMDFLDANPEVVLLGGGFEIIDHEGYYIETVHPPASDRDIRRTLLLRNPFGHASVMFRKEAAEAAGLYSDEHGPTEDYELWIRLRSHGKLAALSRPVYRYRLNQSGISFNSNGTQSDFAILHGKKLWATSPPKVLGRSELRRQFRRYIKASDRPSYGAAVAHQFLSDNTQLALKMLRNRMFLSGIKQLFAVATCNRTGIKVIRARIMITARGIYHAARKQLAGKLA